VAVRTPRDRDSLCRPTLYRRSLRLSGAYNKEDDPIPATEQTTRDSHLLAAGRSRAAGLRLPPRDRPQGQRPAPDRPLGPPAMAPVSPTPPHTVKRWYNAHPDKGLAGLGRPKAKGRPPNIPDTLADEVRRWVIQGPAQQGLDRANWTHAELADHLKKAKGICT